MKNEYLANGKLTSEKIHIYIRTADKKGSLITIPKNSNYSELKHLIKEKLGIFHSGIHLFYQGKQITERQAITFQEKSIVHLVDFSNVNKSSIRVVVKATESGKSERFEVQASFKIGDFIQNQLIHTFGPQEEEAILVYVGKQLNLQKSFYEELVEDNSELIYLCNGGKIHNSPLISNKHQMIQQKQNHPQEMGNCSAKSATLENPDPLFDLIVQKDLEQNQWPEIIDSYKQNTDHQSLMAKNMSRQLFDKLKNYKTPNGWTIAKAINTGTLYPDSFIGCHAGDLESYHEFKEFFYPVIEGCHFGFKMDGSMKHTTDIDSSKIQVKLQKSALDKIVSTRIRCARNLKTIPLNTVGNKQTRNDVLDLLKKVVAELPVDLQGDLMPLEGMTEEKRKELIDLHYLFRGGDKMQAASGYHAFWPSGRGIFLSNDRKFIMWINEGDHLRIISMENGGDIQSVFDRFSRAVTAMEGTIKRITGQEQAFLHDPVIGMIACCPSNLGTCMRGSVHILLPKLIKKIGFKEIDKIARKMGCQARGSTGEHSEVIDRIDISNWRRLGFPEYKLVEDMMRCANELAKMEDEA